MLNVNGLADVIKNSVNGLTDVQKANSLTVHTAYADAVRQYLLDNLDVIGTYSGTISGSPDPLNGVYTWNLASMLDLTGSNLKTGAKSSWIGWRDALRDGIRSGKILGQDNGGVPKVTTSVASFLNAYILNFILADLGKTANFDTAIDLVADRIVNSFSGVLPDPISVAATSSGGGSGTVVFTLIQ